MDKSTCIDPRLLLTNNPGAARTSVSVTKTNHLTPSIEHESLTGLPIADDSSSSVCLSDGSVVWSRPEDAEDSTQVNASSDDGSLLPTQSSDDNDVEGQQRLEITQARNERLRRASSIPHKRSGNHDVLRRLVLDPDGDAVSMSAAAEILESVRQSAQIQFQSTNQVLRVMNSGGQVERLGVSFVNKMSELINMLSEYPDHRKQFKVVGKIVQGCQQAWTRIEAFCVLMSNLHQYPSRAADLRRAFGGLGARLYVERKKLKQMIPDLFQFLAGTSRRSRAEV